MPFNSTEYSISIDDIKRLSNNGVDGNLVPLSRTVNTKNETPVSIYSKVASQPYSFLFESVEGAERIARYSFIGVEPYEVIKTGDGQEHGSADPLGLIEKRLSGRKVVAQFKSNRFDGGDVGYASYETASYFEDLPTADHDSLNLPESVFMFFNTYIMFDHIDNEISIVCHVNLDEDIETSYDEAVNSIENVMELLANRSGKNDRQRYKRFNIKDASNQCESLAKVKFDGVEATVNIDKEYYKEALNKIIDYIYQGDCIQVVFSQRFSYSTAADPLDIYRSLREVNPSPYMFYLDLDDFHIVGASPEMLVRCIDNKIDYHPIAGTRRRGLDDREDASIAEELLTDEKELAEHIMLVDLGRNDVGRVSSPGSVKVTKLMEVELYSHVMHIVSHVTGDLKPSLSCYDAFRSCFPAGTVSGAPKIRAMEILSELEPVKRGAYAGAVGYFSFSGNMDTCIALRTLVIKEGVAHVQAGGGIVADSDIDSEYEETINKASAVMKAISIAEAQSS
ncbi:MAG: anthranilate synthase component I [Dehalococcoidia bacterium]|nr:anthranilate synthase component I [Dehalococcoidia bacterium]